MHMILISHYLPFLTHQSNYRPTFSNFFRAKKSKVDYTVFFKHYDNESEHSQPKFQCRINVVSMSIQRQYLTLKQRQNNVVTLFQHSVDINQSYIESNQASDNY